MKKGKGWRNESRRHSMASRGIKSVQRLPLNTNNLPLQFGIIVPSTKQDKPIKRSEFNKRINDEKEWFSRQFGGDTSVESVGSYWDDEKKKLVQEPGAIVWSSMSIDTYKKNQEKLARRVMANRKRWNQQTVLFKIEGQDFIYPKQDFIDHDKKVKTILVT